MKKDRDLLCRIEALPEPRHLFVLPDWADPIILERLIQEGCLTCLHYQRDAKGVLHLAMGLELTAKGNRLIHHQFEWRQLAMKTSLAGASFAAMSLLILYLG